MATSSFRGGLAMAVVLLPLLLLLALLAPLQCAASAAATCVGLAPAKRRREVISITEFGGVGDGRTVNTWAFRKAVYRIEHQRRRGGTELRVPAGTWLTGSFNLTSHMTLFLARGAVLKATTDTRRWPLVEPLPSYGRGREMPGARYAGFISGNGLRDVVITGDKGVIDGQGEVWWNMWRRRTLQHTRPNLVEFMHSTGIHISNIVLKNSPFWNIHPVYCNNVVVTNMMILAPHDSPNTDGVDPDSSTNVCIEDSYISTGDDLVAIKSGWDEYGIAYNRPSSGITIRRVRGSSPFSGIAIGSEASGGVSDVLVEDCSIFNSGYGIHIKTNVGRGGYIKNVTVDNVRMSGVRVAGVRIAGDAGDHPDANFSQLAVPTVDAVRITNVWGVGVQQPGSLEGIRSSPFTRICLSNVKLFGWRNGAAWRCRDVRGAALGVRPSPCAELATSFAAAGSCSF
ncbi:hypothetical protein HU200_067308 [Digitaria exilis]|uniref:Polygalacturonase n=1 Tax=Digitaria exilis TaxID=1010633 RepID=A0A834ZZY4_9POAL|nr:hypothetical protein HU200_067308 [Digitaria exilis]CAB3449509.1 unnamed protein product [Digitaria exilis]